LFGFQYHFELTPADVEAIVANAKANPDVARFLGADGERRISQDTEKYYPRHARLGNKVLENFVQFLKVY
jgi:hypothetical protein